jgi:hypothetical protein
MRTFVMLVALACGLTPLASPAQAADLGDSQTQTLHTQVTTEGTTVGLARKSATSDWTTVNAPEGYVFIKDNTETVLKSHNGSDNRVDIEYKNNVEIVVGTGIVQPRTICIRSHARSPQNKPGARGWTIADVVVTQVKFK